MEGDSIRLNKGSKLNNETAVLVSLGSFGETLENLFNTCDQKQG